MSGTAEEFEPSTNTNNQIGNDAWLTSQHHVSGVTATDRYSSALSSLPSAMVAPRYKQVAEPTGTDYAGHQVLAHRIVQDNQQRIVYVQYADGTTLRRFADYVMVVNRNKDCLVKLSKLPWCSLD